MAKGADKRLRDALFAAEELASFTASKSLTDYFQDTGLRRIVERLLEIIDEATNQAIRIEPELVDVIPDALFIVGMRNWIAHGYDDLKDDVIWDAATLDVPALAEVLRALLDQRQRSGGNP